PQKTEWGSTPLTTSHAAGAAVKAGSIVTIGGVAWDAGYNIHAVEISTDGGRNWTAAALGADLGRFAFRTFSYDITLPAKGNYQIMARATNKIGQSQASALIANPTGYHHHVVQNLNLVAA